MKMLARAAVALSLALSVTTPSFAQTLYTVKVWDPRFPGRDPIQITTTLNAAAALVQAGVAASVDPTVAGYLATYSLGGATVTPSTGTALDFSSTANSAFIL